MTPVQSINRAAGSATIGFVRRTWGLVAISFLSSCDFVDQSLPRDASAPDAAPFDAAALDAEPLDAEPLDATAQGCPLSARSGTVGLWCFEEGSGTTTSNLAPDPWGKAPDLTGIASTEWVTGGVRPATSAMIIADDPSLDLSLAWTVDVAVTLDSYPEDAVMLVERVDWTATDDLEWLRLEVVAGGGLSCEAGVQGTNDFARSAPAGSLPLGVPTVVSCARAPDGTLAIRVDGARVDTTSGGAAPHRKSVGLDQPLHVGWSACTSGCAITTPLDGIVHALAIHDDNAAACGDLERSGTVGLWCFGEGTGTSTASVATAAAPALTGIVASEWAAGGVRPTTSTMTIADDPALDRVTGWTVELALTLDGYPTNAAMLVERITWPVATASFDQWVRLMLQPGGGLHCEVGQNNGDAYARSAPVASVPLGERSVVSCSRGANGTISIRVNGVQVDTVSSGGSANTVAHAAGEPFHVGWSACTFSCNTLQPINGVIHALAMHDDLQTTCRDLERAGTVGLWCFGEGSGTSTANLATGATAPALTEIDPTEWVPGGVRPTTSNLTIVDDPALDLAAPWTVDTVLTLDSYPASASYLFERVVWPAASSSSEAWARVVLSSSGGITCEVGANNGDAYNRTAPAGSLAVGITSVVRCARAGDGEISVHVNGARVDTTSGGGSPHTTSYALDRPVHVGWSACTFGCGTINRLSGVVHGFAIHDDP